ncbi:MAG: hypothetical protein WDW38_003655 [Sanguina aurantia]
MPIAPKYDWEESEDGLEVRVALSGVSKTSADVSATDVMLKVNIPPYLLILDILHEVDEAKSVATLTGDGVSFKLVKRERGLWGALCLEASKEDLIKRRNESVERSHKRLEEGRQIRLQRKAQEVKDSHSHGGGEEDEEKFGEGDDDGDENGEDVWGGLTDGESAWREVEAQAAAGREQGLVGAGKTQEAGPVTFTPLPPPRTRLQAVPVDFTRLETGHLPARQVREEEIKAYKKKAVDERLLADSVDVADRQPLFLKDKGDALYQQGNYRGAINAYSRGLEIDAEIPLLWANRAACHLQLGDPAMCCDDCSGALMLLDARIPRYEDGSMTPEEVAAFSKQRVRVLVRRAQARMELQQLPLAVLDYQEAIRPLCQAVADCGAAVAVLLAPARISDAPATSPVGSGSGLDGTHPATHEAGGGVIDERGVLDTGVSRGADAEEAVPLRAVLLDWLSKAQPQPAATGGLGSPRRRTEPLGGGGGARPTAAAVTPSVASSSAENGGHDNLHAGHTGRHSEQDEQQQQQQGTEQRQQQQQGTERQEQHATQQAREQQSASSTRPAVEPAGWRLTAAALMRVLGRRGAAHGHLKRYSLAAGDYSLALQLATVLGEEGRAGAFAADQDKMRVLQAEVMV